MSEITKIPKCNCDSHNNRVCDVCQIYIPEINRLKEENKRLNDFIKQTSPRVDVDLCYTQNARYREVLRRIADSITNDPQFAYKSVKQMAKEALKEVQGE